VLLVPWMVYTVVFLIAIITVLLFESAAYFAMGDTARGVGGIVGAVIHVCK
jgi:hypothetical protein